MNENGPDHSGIAAAEAATDSAMGQMRREALPNQNNSGNPKGTELLRQDIHKVDSRLKRLGRGVRNLFSGHAPKPETNFVDHSDSGASEVSSVVPQQQVEEQAQFRETSLAVEENTAGYPANSVKEGSEITTANAGPLATVEQRAIEPDGQVERPGPQNYTDVTRGLDSGPDIPVLPAGKSFKEGEFRELSAGEEQQALGGPAETAGVSMDNQPEATTNKADEQSDQQDLDAGAAGWAGEGGYYPPQEAQKPAETPKPENVPGVPSWTGNEADDDILRGIGTDDAQQQPVVNTESNGQKPTDEESDQQDLDAGAAGWVGEGGYYPPDNAPKPTNQPTQVENQDEDPSNTQPPSAETPTPETTPLITTTSETITDPDLPTGPDTLNTTEAPTSNITSGETDPDRNAREAAAREQENAEIARLEEDLKLKRNEYIKARAVTRSFWRNLWGNIRSFGSEDHSSPAADRKAKRATYEIARDKLIKFRAETDAKRKGLSVPEMPGQLTPDASDDEKAEHAAKTTKAEQDKKKYDQEILNSAIQQIAKEKYELAKADFENMNSNNDVVKVLDRLRKNPTVRMAISGGLLASTATGFIPGVMAFGVAQTGLSIMGMKGALDFGAEKYAGSWGDEKKNLTLEELKSMDQNERNKRDAALLEMGIKNQQKEPGKAEKRLEAMSQERIKEIVTGMMQKGEITGDNTQKRTAEVVKAILEQGNLNMSIDSKIDSNRRWNAGRWVAALAGTAALGTYLQSPGGEDIKFEEMTVQPQTPTIETTSVTPWEHVSGNGYSWSGWQEGEIRKYLQMAGNLQGEAELQNWISTHPTEYAQAKAALTDAMRAANPGLDVSGQGVLGQEYKMPTNLRSVIEDALHTGTNVR